MDIKVTAEGVVSGALGIACLFYSGFVWYQQIGEVNRKLPEDQQISYLWMYAEKGSDINRRYRRFYPNGRLNLLKYGLQVAGIALCILALIFSGLY